MTEEEKAGEKYQEHINKENCYVSKPDEEIYTDGFLDGLSEGKPKWHDLRKDPNDLPNRNLPVYVQFADGDNYVAKYIDIRWSDKSCWVDQYDSTDYIHDVIAWCERPQFEEK